MTRLRKLLLALGVIIAAVLLPTVALASGLDEPTPVGPDAVTADSALNIPPFIVSVILGIAIPLVTGFFTKLTTPSWVKYGLTTLLAAVAGLVNVSLVDGGGAVISWSAASAAALTWLAAMAAYAGWTTVGVTSSVVTRVDENGVLVTEPGKLATVGVK
jgi:hypothetical protein